MALMLCQMWDAHHAKSSGFPLLYCILSKDFHSGCNVALTMCVIIPYVSCLSLAYCVLNNFSSLGQQWQAATYHGTGPLERKSGLHSIIQDIITHVASITIISPRHSLSSVALELL